MKSSSSKHIEDGVDNSDNESENGNESPLAKMQKRIKQPALAEIISKIKQMEKDHKEINDINK